ncbi:unnamed protein product [Penicillium nalgiovense]|nr:unnamed protein product [Penicillium nalgiovense]
MPKSTSYENIPSDYITMKMVKTPRTGGDTLFASCYGAYDRLSGPWQTMADSLSCMSVDICKRKKLIRNTMKLHIMSRILCRLQIKESSFGWDLEATLTMPVAALKQDILKLITDNHDLQYRHRWEPGDVVIWDKYVISGTIHFSNQKTSRNLHMYIVGLFSTLALMTSLMRSGWRYVSPVSLLNSTATLGLCPERNTFADTE